MGRSLSVRHREGVQHYLTPLTNPIHHLPFRKQEQQRRARRKCTDVAGTYSCHVSPCAMSAACGTGVRLDLAINNVIVGDG